MFCLPTSICNVQFDCAIYWCLTSVILKFLLELIVIISCTISLLPLDDFLCLQCASITQSEILAQWFSCICIISARYLLLQRSTTSSFSTQAFFSWGGVLGNDQHRRLTLAVRRFPTKIPIWASCPRTLDLHDRRLWPPPHVTFGDLAVPLLRGAFINIPPKRCDIVGANSSYTYGLG